MSETCDFFYCSFLPHATRSKKSASVKILTLHHKKPEIHHELVEACGEDAMALQTVQKWAKYVQDGENSTQARSPSDRSGRPSTSNEEEHLQQLRVLLENDRRWTCDEFVEQKHKFQSFLSYYHDINM